ncbi:hypothetical protein PMAYCL1PPCAC_22965, partial [Pristionchus mayeri]
QLARINLNHLPLPPTEVAATDFVRNKTLYSFQLEGIHPLGAYVEGSHWWSAGTHFRIITNSYLLLPTRNSAITWLIGLRFLRGNFGHSNRSNNKGSFCIPL